jgi:hypothetical protein
LRASQFESRTHQARQEEQYRLHHVICKNLAKLGVSRRSGSALQLAGAADERVWGISIWRS